MRVAALVLVGMLSFAFVACKDDPVTPPPQQTHGDTVKHHFTLWYDSTQLFVAHDIKFAYTAALPPWPPYTIRWIFDTTVFNVKNWDSTSYSFTTPGQHFVKVLFVDSIGAVRDSANSVLNIIQLPPPPDPNDTSSHDFVWTETRLPTTYVTEDKASACWVFGPNDIYVMNWLLYHYDGSAWTKVNPKTTAGKDLDGLADGSLFAFSKTDFWIVKAAAAFHVVNGVAQAYSTYYMNHGALYTAWGTSSNDMYFVGDSGLIAHFDGKTMTQMHTPTKKGIGEIWGRNANDIWADGWNPETGESVMLHYDGKLWSEIDLNTIGNIGIGKDALAGIWVTDSAGHRIVYAIGTHIWKHVDDGAWSSDGGKIGNDVGLYYSGGNSANDYMVVGDGQFITHWNGRSWHRYDELYNPSLLYILRGMSFRGNTACIVGMKNGTSSVWIGQRK